MNDKFKAWIDEKFPHVAHWKTDIAANELALWVIEDPEAAGFTVEEITGQKSAEDFPIDWIVEWSYSFLSGEITRYLTNKQLKQYQLDSWESR